MTPYLSILHVVFKFFLAHIVDPFQRKALSLVANIELLGGAFQLKILTV